MPESDDEQRPGGMSLREALRVSVSGVREGAANRVAIVRLSREAGRGLVILAVVLAVLESGMSLAFTVVTGLVVGAVPGTIAAGFDSPEGSRLVVLVGVLAGLFVLDHVSGPFRSVVNGVVHRRIDGELRTRALAAAVRVAVSVISRRRRRATGWRWLPIGRRWAVGRRRTRCRGS